MLPMPRARIFPKDLSILLAQTCYVRAPQSLHFQQHASIHTSAPLPGCSPHSHERSFRFDMQAPSRYSPKPSQAQRFKDIAANQQGLSSNCVWGAKRMERKFALASVNYATAEKCARGPILANAASFRLTT